VTEYSAPLRTAPPEPQGPRTRAGGTAVLEGGTRVDFDFDAPGILTPKQVTDQVKHDLSTPGRPPVAEVYYSWYTTISAPTPEWEARRRVLEKEYAASQHIRAFEAACRQHPGEFAYNYLLSTTGGHSHIFDLAEREAALAASGGWRAGDPITAQQRKAYTDHIKHAKADSAARFRARSGPASEPTLAPATPPKPEPTQPAADPEPVPTTGPASEAVTTYGAAAPVLWRHGFMPVPLRHRDKAPAVNDWQRPRQPDAQMLRAYADAGCGILTAVSPAVDVDVRDPAAVADLRVMARAILGDTPCIRVGKAPKFAALYRAGQRFPKIVGRWLALPGDADFDTEDYVPHRIEVLGDGQQLVSHAIHPGTGQPYDWDPGDPLQVPLGKLPAIDSFIATLFVDSAETLLIEHHGAIPVRARARSWQPSDLPRGQRRAKNPANWWWLSMPFEHLAEALELSTEGTHAIGGKVKRWSQSSLATRCPNHNGAHGNSLNFALAPDGTVLLHCFGDCDPEDVAEAISDLLKEQFWAEVAAKTGGRA
jgi:hypothetical protein